MFKKYIEDALYAQPGVSIAELNLGNKVVSIKYNTQKTDDKTLKKAIHYKDSPF